MSKENLLHHILEKSGIKVYLEKVKAIMKIPFLVNNKSLHSFLGKINFLLKFVSDYAQILKPMEEMVKKDVVYKWDKGGKYAFSYINQAIVEELSLRNPNFNKVFLLYTFASNTSLFAMIM